MSTVMIQMTSTVCCVSVSVTTCLRPLHCSCMFETVSLDPVSKSKKKKKILFTTVSLESSVGHKASIQMLVHKRIMVITCFIKCK